MLDKAKAICLLIYKQANGELSIEERTELDEFIQASAENAELVERLTSEAGIAAILQQYEADDRVWQGEELQLTPVVPLSSPKKIRLLYIAAAAIIVIFLGVAILYTFLPKKHVVDPPETASRQSRDDLPPGGRRAVLRLADQSTIDLDSAGSGVLARQGNTLIEKGADGSVQYNNTGKVTEVGLQTLETPNGGYYVLQLADGSRCWVNAASKLRFPAAFAGTERRVHLSGEAYFEVATNKSQPFLVETDNGTVIRVTGTKFNVNAYGDEPVEQTSLLEGSVTINFLSFQQKLIPGRQATINKADGAMRVADANVGATVRWTQGLFSFNRASLQEVLRQISRWYDIEVEYGPGVGKSLQMQGSCSRNIPLREVLDILQRYDDSIEYTLTGKRLFVQKRGNGK